MKVYAVAALEIQDRAWVQQYVAEVTPMVERAGGRFLARTNRFEQLEGEPRTPGTILLIQEWPSREIAIAFYESDEYRPYRDARVAGSRSTFLLVPGEDVTKAAKIDG